MMNLEFTKCDLPLDEMYVDFHVLGPTMMNRVLCEVNRRYVVTIHYGSLVDDDV
jgi:hypothetical protein